MSWNNLTEKTNDKEIDGEDGGGGGGGDGWSTERGAEAFDSVTTTSAISIISILLKKWIHLSRMKKVRRWEVEVEVHDRHDDLNDRKDRKIPEKYVLQKKYAKCNRLLINP